MFASPVDRGEIRDAVFLHLSLSQHSTRHHLIPPPDCRAAPKDSKNTARVYFSHYPELVLEFGTVTPAMKRVLGGRPARTKFSCRAAAR